MNKVGIFYGSTTGNTESIANVIQEKIGSDLVDVYSVDSASLEDVEKYDNLIFGTSTWGIGDIQDDFQGFLDTLANANLDGKVVALYGLGDSASYPDSFCGGMGELYETINSSGCTIVGKVSKEEYDFDDSQALNGDEFVGLPLDEDNESDKHEERISQWLDSIKESFK